MSVYSNNIVLNARTAGYMPVSGQNAPISSVGNNKENTFESTSVENISKDRTAGIEKMNAESKEDWSFLDFIDVINPLQHIPLVNSAYRSITGDEIKPSAKAMGGLIFGGPIGLVSAIVNGIVTDATGEDIQDNIVSALVYKEESAEYEVPSKLIAQEMI